jgi:hypothetical protein
MNPSCLCEWRRFSHFALLYLPLLLLTLSVFVSKGLGVVYAINTVLAVLAVFKAGERGQPAPLWIAKTFSVGGLAYDQLTQLPTVEEMEKAKARKGKRALSNNKKFKK